MAGFGPIGGGVGVSGGGGGMPNTSAAIAAIVTDETGSGSLVMATSPTLTTPNIGVATATSVNGFANFAALQVHMQTNFGGL